VAKLLPGKGAFLILNDGVLQFQRTALMDIAQVYTDDLHDTKPKTVITLLCAGGDRFELKWEEVKDDFGHKAYASMPYKTGELRVTVVLTKQDELKLDVREWYNPDAARS